MLYSYFAHAIICLIFIRSIRALYTTCVLSSTNSYLLTTAHSCSINVLRIQCTHYAYTSMLHNLRQFRPMRLNLVSSKCISAVIPYHWSTTRPCFVTLHSCTPLPSVAFRHLPTGLHPATRTHHQQPLSPNSCPSRFSSSTDNSPNLRCLCLSCPKGPSGYST